MAWVRLDDGFFQHPKVLGLSHRAKLLYLAGLTYASSQLTDGRIAAPALRLVAGQVAVSPRLAAELVGVGLWTETEDGYMVHDYLAYNPSRTEVLRQRKQAAERTARWRGKGRRRDAPSNGVTDGVSTLSPAHGPAHGPAPLVADPSSSQDPRQARNGTGIGTVYRNGAGARGDDAAELLDAARAERAERAAYVAGRTPAP